MNPYDKMLNEIVDFKKYLDDIIAKGYRNDIAKLSSIYHMIKEFKEDSIEQSTIGEYEHQELEPPEYELSDLEDETIDMREVEELLDQLNDDDVNEPINMEPEIILYKNNKEYLDKFKQFMDTMEYY
jgi:hypothetical protein